MRKNEPKESYKEMEIGFEQTLESNRLHCNERIMSFLESRNNNYMWLRNCKMRAALLTLVAITDIVYTVSAISSALKNISFCLQECLFYKTGLIQGLICKLLRCFIELTHVKPLDLALANKFSTILIIININL